MPIIIGKGHVGIVAIMMMITRVMTSFTVCLVIPTTTTKLIKEVRLFKMQPCIFSTCGHEFNFIVNVNVRSNQQIWWAGFICSPAEAQTEYKWRLKTQHMAAPLMCYIRWVCRQISKSILDTSLWLRVRVHICTLAMEQIFLPEHYCCRAVLRG